MVDAKRVGDHSEAGNRHDSWTWSAVRESGYALRETSQGQSGQDNRDGLHLMEREGMSRCWQEGVRNEV